MAPVDFEAEKDVARKLLEELKPFFRVSAWHFRADLALTALAGWGSLAALTFLPLNPPLWMLAFLVCYAGFYRGQAFIHEAVHFQARVRGLRPMYNLLFGFPNRVPLFTHDPHRYHHLPNTFATAADPEYDRLAGRGWKAVLHPLTVGLLSPWLLMLRFGVLPLVSWMLPRPRRLWIYRRLSTIVVNPAYDRPLPSENELKTARREELACSLFFLAFAAGLFSGAIPWRGFFAWLLMASSTAFVNVCRARVAHLYDNHAGERLSPLGQLRDSVTVESRFLSFLWAPAGMQYHSLHHLAPQIPYHNLQAAHARLRETLPIDHPYRQTLSPRFGQAARRFVRTTMRPLA